MKKVMLALASVCALASAIPAHAAAIDFVVNGTFAGGQKLSGGFTFDDSKDIFKDIYNVSLTLGSVTYKDYNLVNRTDTTTVGLGFGPISGDYSSRLYLVVPATVNGSLDILSVSAGALGSASYVSYQGQNTALIESGTISVKPVTAAVPEPATWALMILGFGAVGYAIRRRPKVSVRFA